MATITSTQSGDFSDTATWAGGVVPTVGDIAVAATGHVVAIDVDVTVDKVTQAGTGKFTLGNGRTLTAEVEANAGTFTSGGTVEVTATSGNTAYIVGNVTGVTSTTASVAAIVITGTGTLDITGNVTGSPGNADAAVIYSNVACNVIVDGIVRGGSGVGKVGVRAGPNATGTWEFLQIIQGGSSTNAVAVQIQGNANVDATAGIEGTFASGTSAHGMVVSGNSAVINVTGDLVGRNLTSHALFMTGSSVTVTVIGNLTGTTAGANGRGIDSTGASVNISITGDVVGGLSLLSHGLRADNGTITITGDVKGGSAAGTTGIQMTAGSLTITGDVISQGGGAIGSTGAINIDVIGLLTVSSGGPAILAPSNTSCIVDGPITVDAGNRWPLGVLVWSLRDSNTTIDVPTVNDGVVTYVNEDSVNGLPAEADVRDGTAYGALGGLTGTLAVPDPQYVLPGVPTDDTVGTLDLVASIADVTGAQIAAAITS
jgi:hypothetical protein